MPPSTIKRQASLIAAAAKRLLRALEIYDYRKAAEGPRDLALLDALSLADDGMEDDVVRATERVGRLVEIFDGIDAAEELECRGLAATSDASQTGRLTTLRGRRGNPAMNSWMTEMMPIYKVLTGKDPRISVNAHGKPTGPFLRFLKAASKPLEVDGNPMAFWLGKRKSASGFSGLYRYSSNERHVHAMQEKKGSESQTQLSDAFRSLRSFAQN